MNSITQDMKYRQSLLTYSQKYGAHLFPEIRRKPGQPQVQQKPLLYLLLASSIRWFSALPGLPVPTSS